MHDGGNQVRTTFIDPHRVDDIDSENSSTNTSITAVALRGIIMSHVLFGLGNK